MVTKLKQQRNLSDIHNKRKQTAEICRWPSEGKTIVQQCKKDIETKEISNKIQFSIILRISKPFLSSTDIEFNAKIRTTRQNYIQTKKKEADIERQKLNIKPTKQTSIKRQNDLQNGNKITEKFPSMVYGKINCKRMYLRPSKLRQLA